MKLVKSKESDLKNIIELRQEVLHPGGPRERVVYDQDELTTTVHLISRDEKSENLLVTGTLILEFEEDEGAKEYRIRGMAVRESFRGQGFGSKLLDKFIEVAKEDGVKKVWCNARVIALSLYERKGFVKIGEPFDVPGSGPHYRMQLYL